MPNKPPLQYEGIYVAHSGRATSGTVRRATFRFGMIPFEVGTDPKLTSRDVHVYFMLAACRRGVTASVGTRFIQESIRIGRNAVARSIKNLVASGHIAVEPAGKGKRPVYSFTSPLFTGKVVPEAPASQDEPEGVAGADRGLLKCGKCGTRCKRLFKTGWCSQCNWESKVSRVVRKELAS